MSGEALELAALGSETPEQAARWAERLAVVHAQSFAKPWDVDALIRMIKGPGAFTVVATLGVPIQGFVVGRALAGEAEILTLAVAPSARGQGVGRALVEAAVLAARAFNAQVLWLEVAVDNIEALGLYGATGFEQAGRRKAYYAREDSRPIDALVMRRTLNTGAR